MERTLVLLGAAPLSIPILASSHVRADEGQMSRGARFYSDNCTRCHNLRSPSEHDDRD